MVTTIALLSDIGAQDAFVGIMKGVITNLNPQARVIDITHAIPPGDIQRTAFELWRATPYFLKETFFLAVIDLGIGDARLPVAISWPEYICVGPDNGFSTYLLTREQPISSVELSAKEYLLETVSETFHGRDIFAPVAAHLSCGVSLPLLGPPIEDLVRLPLPLLHVTEETTIHGETLHRDRFGNWLTSVDILQWEYQGIPFDPWLPNCPGLNLPQDNLQVSLPDKEHLAFRRTFGDVPEGELTTYIKGAGLLESAVNAGSAANQLAITSGQEIQFGLRG